MQMIRKRHKKTKEAIKELLISLVQQNGLGSSVQWNDFQFSAKGYGTTVQGEIFENELHVDISGLFEKRAAQKLQEGWKKLVIKGLV
ncbi:hypothetical protein CSA56_00935 [candidate division KSB3 bacterium]|uniref:Uncharacterized protein n=1 Tax=candidate division KSB3 bacterium TaxID=2044937 RepID=A0A2G6KKM9_9BACT|nr:MAG: hypothetical protein CSA56_00935 [candidate division KSB3 bacterium]